MDKAKLRGKIYENYKSVSKCAQSMGWSRQRLHLIVNGKRVPDVDDVREISTVLKLSNDEMLSIFLPS